MKPRISIITPSYNQSQYLEETIESVLSQGYDRLEYIIIDGGSTDGSVDILKKHQKYLSYWISEKDDGQSQAINKGLKIAKGEIINWLNSDDYLQPGALEVINNNFADPSVNVVIGRSNIVQDQKIIRTTMGTDVYPGNLSKTIGLARIDQPETYFRKSAIDVMGLLNTRLHYVMDKEWWIRYLLIFGLNGIKKIDDLIVNFRLHGSSKTVANKAAFIEDGFQLVLKMCKLTHNSEAFQLVSKLVQTVRSNDVEIPVPQDVSILRQSLNYTFLYLSDYYYVNNDYAVAKKFLDLTDPRLLAVDDHAWYSRMKNRLKIPVWLKKFYKTLKD